MGIPILDPSKDHRRTYCPRCKKDSDQILIIEAATMLYVCPVCDMKYYGKLPSHCLKCGNSTYGIIGRSLAELEKIPNMCGDCVRELKERLEENKAGGVGFFCKRCKRTGIVHAGSPFARNFRKKVGRLAPLECYVQLETCPECEKREIKDDK